jgi:hypothetical protein
VPALTVIVNDAVPVLPCESVAVQVTVVVPIGNLDPEINPPGAEHETEITLPYWSVAVGDAHDSIMPLALVAVTTMFEGVPEMVGKAVLGLTVTELEAALFVVTGVEAESVAVTS